MTHSPATPTRDMAQALLTVAEQAAIGRDFGAPFMAVARVLRPQGHDVVVFSKTIEHPGGLIGCTAL